MLTINQIIESVNVEIAGKKNQWYSAWNVRDMLQKHFSGVLISDSDGVYFYVNRGDDKYSDTVNTQTALVLIKATRERREVKSRWDGPSTRMSICQLELLTPNSDKTPDEITAIYREQAASLYQQQQNAEKQDYLKVIEFLKKTGATIDEVGSVFSIYEKRKYSWSNLKEKYS